jgi:hypothetical protein
MRELALVGRRFAGWEAMSRRRRGKRAGEIEDRNG